MTINTTRVLLAGLAAGVVINFGEFFMNTFLLADGMKEAMTKLNLSTDYTTGQIAWFNVWGFAAGILIAWLFAALRPGVGGRAALSAALAVWFMGWVMSNLIPVVLGMFPAGLGALAAIGGLVECVACSFLVPKVYRD